MNNQFLWQTAKWIADGIDETSGSPRRGSNWLDAWDLAWLIYYEEIDQA